MICGHDLGSGDDVIGDNKYNIITQYVSSRRCVIGKFGTFGNK